MTDILDRKEPVIRFGIEPAAPTSEATAPAFPMRNITREARPTLPTGLTRATLLRQARGDIEGLRDTLNLSPDTFAALSTELEASGGAPLGDEAILAAMHALFDCEPIEATTAHSLVLVGGSHSARVRAAMSLAQRLQRSDRRVALYSLQEGRFPTPRAMYSGGLDILTVGTVDACIDAVRATEADELAIIEASCLDAGAERANTLPMLTLSLSAEAIYVDDGTTPIPDFDLFSSVERFILSGRPTPARFGALLDAAYRGRQAFAGQSMGLGVFHPMTTAMLAERFAASVR